MSELKTRFDAATEAVTQLSEAPDNATKLKLYALFKQATQGDATGDRPGLTDFVGRAKFDAWSKLKGTPNDAAMNRYIDLVEALKAAD